MAYSTVVTYLLWLTLGWFGAHHFYLRRDRHAFVWLWTLGGGCGIGWLFEIFRLPSYVRTANMEALHAAGQGAYLTGGQPDARPPFRLKRFIGVFVFSIWVGCLAMTSIPEETTDICPWLIAVVTPAGVAIGAYTVANIGAEQCDLVVALATAYAMFPFFVTSATASKNAASHDTSSQDDSAKNALSGTLTKAALSTSLAVTYNWGQSVIDTGNWLKARLLLLRNKFAARSRRYRKVAPVRRPLCKRIAIFCVCSIVMGMLSFSAIYFNTYITTDYGEKVKVRVAVENFFSSPAWMDFRETGYRFWQMAGERESYRDFFEQLRTAFDIEGEQNAYTVLNLTPSATEKEINDRHKELVRKFHPDRFTSVEDEEEKRKIGDRFIEIQQAYERVSTIKAKRMRKNKINDEL